jgi:hypothetical protein
MGQHGRTTMRTGCRVGLLCSVCSTDSCAESCFVWVVSPRVPHRLATVVQPTARSRSRVDQELSTLAHHMRTTTASADLVLFLAQQ